LRALPGLVAALAAIYAGGLAWLAVVGSVDTAVALGLRPFILADLVKVGMVVLVMARFRERVLRLFGS
ncbi:MAG: biotin transporter BioY, partial [Gemmatimonadota bacterium]